MSHDNVMLAIRLLSQCRDGDGECMLWNADVVEGIGIANVSGELLEARRLVYMLFCGLVFPLDKITTSCGNSLCVNSCH